MKKFGRKYVEAAKNVDKTKSYSAEEAIRLAKNSSITKFDGKNEEAVEAYYRAEYYGSVVGPTVNFINNL